MSTSLREALEPCPFCGCTKIDGGLFYDGTRMVECRDCGAGTPGVSHADAIAAWNRRAALVASTPPADDAELADLRAALKSMADSSIAYGSSLAERSLKAIDALQAEVKEQIARGNKLFDAGIYHQERAERLEAEVGHLNRVVAARDQQLTDEIAATGRFASRLDETTRNLRAAEARAERMRERLKTVAHMIQSDLVTEAYHHAIQEDN